MRNYLKAPKPISEVNQENLQAVVRDIITAVKREGDAALKAFSYKFDGIEDLQIQVPADEIAKAYQSVPTSVVEDLRFAASQIRKFAQAQLEAIRPLEVEVLPGVHLGHRVIPVKDCGAYIPGGRYPLPSSALMSIIPARVAGVERVVACSPPSRETRGINPVTLVAMDIAGADAIYAMGGAQAIAALAYGTETVKPVDIIVGPGNQYVTEAKRQVSGDVGIDFLAGPSEVLVIADASADPTYVACDLLAQSEHDPQARGILVTTSEELGRKVIGQVEAWLQKLATAEIARASWENHGQVVVVDTVDEAVDLANEIAPEHLEIQVEDPEKLVEGLRNYGSLFIGSHAAEVFGDYVAGTNHILPTMRTSRFTGGVWVGTFLKVVTHQRLEPQGVQSIAPVASRLAEVEGLYGHQAAALVRIKNQT
ncbi:MAG: histidinol dehydrogenase [Clostridia bacterium]|nr:histidinol dehydrogenase [Clostridia bacterium]